MLTPQPFFAVLYQNNMNPLPISERPPLLGGGLHPSLMLVGLHYRGATEAGLHHRLSLASEA